MKKSSFTEEQVVYALRQAEAGPPVTEVCRKLGVTEQTCLPAGRRSTRLGGRYAGVGVAELRRLRQVEDGKPQAETAGGRSQPGYQCKLKVERTPKP